MDFRETRSRILKILEEEIVEAAGCTEPVAIAYVANKLASVLGRMPKEVNIYLSGDMIKNAKNVTIPNSNGRKGIEVATAMGLLFTKRVIGKGFMILSDVDTTRLHEIDRYIRNNKITVTKVDDESNLYIRMEGITDGGTEASVEVRHFHTNITSIKLNDVVIVDALDVSDSYNYFYEDRNILSIKTIYNFSRSVTLERVKPLFKEVMEKNINIANAGLEGKF